MSREDICKQKLNEFRSYSVEEVIKGLEPELKRIEALSVGNKSALEQLVEAEKVATVKKQSAANFEALSRFSIYINKEPFNVVKAVEGIQSTLVNLEGSLTEIATRSQTSREDEKAGFQCHAFGIIQLEQYGQEKVPKVNDVGPSKEENVLSERE